MNIFYNICRRFDTAGTPCDVKTMETFDINTCANIDKEKGNLYGLQVFDCGYRVSKSEDNLFNHWNGCIFVDLDSKNAPGNHDENFWNHFEANLYTYLSERHTNNFYWMQRSASCKSFHICFYYNIEDTDKNANTFIKLSKYSNNIIKNACDWMGLADWKNTKGVFDEHQEVSVQLLYLSSNPIYFNNINYYNGELMNIGNIDLGKIEDVKVKDDYDILNKEIIISSNNYKIISNNNYNEIDWEHTNRLRLVSVLAKYFNGDKNKVWECYKEVIPTMTRQNHGTFNRLQSLFNAQFNGIVKSNFNLSTSMVKFASQKFSLDIGVKDEQTFNISDYNVFTPDETINLNKDEFISDHYENIITNVDLHKNVYIKGGCGIGKSYFFKKLIRTEEKVIIVCHLNSIKNSVYAVEICGEDNPYNVVIPSSTDLRKMIAMNNLPSKIILGWDQFAILAEKNINIDEYYKCFDEVHNFVTTLNYRYNTTWNIIKNRDIQKRCILVSATPCGETNAFCSDCYRIEFKKEVNYTVNYHKVSWDDKISIKNDSNVNPVVQIYNNIEKLSVFNAINKTAKKMLEKSLFDKVVIFDNHEHAKYAETWKNMACHYCKRNRNSSNIKKLSETNILEENIFITTVYGTEGIEIKNHVNNLAILIPLNAEITDTLVEQLMNRFRDKDHVDVFFFENGKNKGVNVDPEYDAIINNILENVKNDNPEYLHWIEQENYYISHWLHWPNTDIKEYIETFPKMVMIFHNYLLSHGLSESKLIEKYDINNVNYLTYGQDDDEDNKNDIVYKLIGKYPQLVFERNDEDNCCELLTQFSKNLIKTTNKTNSDIFNVEINDTNNKINYRDIRTLRDTIGYLHNLYDSFGGDYKMRMLWNDNSSENISLLSNTAEGKFLVKLINAFTVRKKFKFSSFKRFIRTRKIVNSECLTEKQLEGAKIDIEWYKEQIERLGVNDNLNLNIFNSLYYELINTEFDTLGTRKEKGKYKGKAIGKAIGKSIGKAITKKYVSLENPFIEFTSHEECYEYLKKECKISCTLGSYIKKGIWKQYFSKG